jgi:hypothetical protein
MSRSKLFSDLLYKALLIFLVFLSVSNAFSFAAYAQGVVYNYEICVRTDLRESAGTDDDISVSFQNQQGQWTQDFNLDNENDNFEQGGYECFKVFSDLNLEGKIAKIRVNQEYNDIRRHRCRGPLDAVPRNNSCPYPKWYPLYIQIAQESTQDYSFFFINKWLYADVTPAEFKKSE